jgi:glycosyltransferase involved in cell wall biosynthesis
MIAREAETVLTVGAFPQYLTGYASEKRYERKCLLRETVDGIDMLRIRMPPLRQRGWLNRLVVFAFFTAATVLLIPFMRRISRRPDIVFALSPVLLSCIPSYVMARLFRAKLVLDMPDLWPEELGIIKGASASVLKIAGGLLARWIYTLPDFVTAAGSRMARTIEAKYHPRKVAVLYSGVDTSRFRPIPKSEARAQLSRIGILPVDLQEGRILLYSGVIGPAYGLFDLVRVISAQNEGRLVLLLVGDGEHREMIQKQVERSGTNRVILVRSRPREELPMFINAADFCLIPSMHVEISTYAVPTKLFEYLACGRPVACTHLHGTVPTLIIESGAGVVADLGELTKILSELDEGEVESMGKKARLVSDQFSIESISKKMKAIVQDLLNSESEDDSQLWRETGRTQTQVATFETQ